MAIAVPTRAGRFEALRRRWQGGVLLCLVVLGAALRLYGLGRESLWLDEIDEVTTAALPLPEMLSNLRWHVSPPLEYLIMHGVVRLGFDETLVRLPAALFGIAAIPILFVAGRRLHSAAVGLGAAALLAISLPAVAYAQEARMYSLLILLSALLLERSATVLEAPTSWRRWLLAGAVALLLLYTHYFALLTLMGLGLGWLLLLASTRQRGPLLWRGVVTFGLVGVLFLPWVPMVLRQSAERGGVLSYALARADFWRIMIPFLGGGIHYLLVLLFAALFGLALLASLRQARGAGALLVAFVVVPLLGTYLVPTFYQTVTPRNLLGVLPAYLLGVAWGVATLVYGVAASPAGRLRARLRLHPGAAQAVALGATLVLALVPAAPLLRTYYDSIWWMKAANTDWRQTAAFLQQAMRPGDLVLVADTRVRYLLSFYLDPLAIAGQSFTGFLRTPGTDVSGAWRYVPMVAATAPPVELRERLAAAPQVWVVYPVAETLAAVGVNTARLQAVETGLNVPLALMPAEALAPGYTAPMGELGQPFGAGWSPHLYTVGTEPVRWMGAEADLDLPVWEPANNMLQLTLYAPPNLAAGEVGITAGGSEVARQPLQAGWQTLTATLPVALLQPDTILPLHIGVRAPASVPPFAIGTTGHTAPVPLAVESIGVWAEAAARLHVAGQPYGMVNPPPLLRGYNLFALDAQSAQVSDAQVFDLHADGAANEAMRAWVAALPPGTIVAGAIHNDGSASLNDVGVAALGALGSAVDMRGHFQEAHAFIGVKGAAPGTALEQAFGDKAAVVLAADPQIFVVAISEITLRPSVP